jgi:hypothetical protein
MSVDGTKPDAWNRESWTSIDRHRMDGRHQIDIRGQKSMDERKSKTHHRRPRRYRALVNSATMVNDNVTSKATTLQLMALQAL